jgi:hypothetical protein
VITSAGVVDEESLEVSPDRPVIRSACVKVWLKHRCPNVAGLWRATGALKLCEQTAQQSVHRHLHHVPAAPPPLSHQCLCRAFWWHADQPGCLAANSYSDVCWSRLVLSASCYDPGVNSATAQWCAQRSPCSILTIKTSRILRHGGSSSHTDHIMFALSFQLRTIR